MEPNPTSAAVDDVALIHQAEGLLAALLDVPVEQAVISLDLKAQFDGRSTAATARRILDDHEQRVGAAAPRAVEDRTLAILRQHLDPLTSPTS